MRISTQIQQLNERGSNADPDPQPLIQKTWKDAPVKGTAAMKEEKSMGSTTMEAWPT